ncbi:hypothetical protein GOBAR_DD03828 [Gossypium barbadense]|nr:hypothetical protein GOBAR_DD03828 [Gossypium barbadense]
MKRGTIGRFQDCSKNWGISVGPNCNKKKIKGVTPTTTTQFFQPFFLCPNAETLCYSILAEKNMQATPLFYPPLKNPNLKPLYFRYSSTFSTKPPLPYLGFPRFPSKVHRFIKNCIVSSHELSHLDTEITAQNGGFPLCDRVNEGEDDKMLGTQSLWSQIKEIVIFTGPATGLWICGPLMSLIDTAVIGQGSSIELAALDSMVQDKNEVQHQISVLLFVGLTGGLFMLFFTKFFGSWALTAFMGPNNAHIVPAANTYVQIRGLAWPAVLVGWVAQSASLGMKDSWGPLKALAVASAVNGIGDIVLCSFLGYGIAGAAWATMVSQVVAGYMMITSLNKKGYNAYTISIPSLDDLQTISGLAAPVFIMMMAKARTLLKSLVIIGASLGLILGIVGTSVPWLFPNIFTSDRKVIHEMHKVLAPYFVALAVTPATHSLEGTLLAGRDLKFVSLSMSGCFSLGAVVLLLVSSGGYGLSGCWYALLGFQWARFFLSLQRLLSPTGILHYEESNNCKPEKLKSA